MKFSDSIIEADDDYLFVPRSYQKDALDSIENLYKDGVNRQLIFMATGLGKSSGVMMHLPRRFPHHVLDHGMLFLAHRRKILQQAYRDFTRAYPNLWVGLEMGEHEAVGLEDVVFASVESMGREYQTRIKKYQDRKFGVVVADEGHHVKEDSTWDRVLNFFGVGSDEDQHYNVEVQGEEIPPLSVFLTATPTRNDDHTLAPFLDAVASRMSIVDGIRGGWLTDIKAHRANDRDQVSLDEQGEINFLVQVFRKYLKGERTLIFARSVDQSEKLSHNIEDHGLASTAHIDAETPKDEREDIYQSFEQPDGDISVLSNRLVLTEGYDNPSITAILDNAPTESKPLHIQKIGRGLRPHPVAEVDKYDTAEERKNAIRQSPKPHLLYISTFEPTKHSLDIVADLTADVDVDPEGEYVVEEVIDVIERFEEEAPEIDVSEFDSVKDIEVTLQRANLLTQTLYSDELKALTPLNWIVENDHAALYLDRNPFVEQAHEYYHASCVIEFIDEGGGIFTKRVIGGGWNGNVPLKNRSVSMKVRAEDLHECIRKQDKWLLEEDENLYYWATRETSEPATDDMKRYLDNKQIPYKGNLTKETARLLIDREKIKQKRADA